MKEDYAKRLQVISAIFILLVIVIFLFYKVIKLSLFNPSNLREFIYGYGAFAPAVLIFIQAAQAIFPILPAPLIILVSGILFGFVWGSIYSLVGLGIGISVTFFLARKYGRKRIEGYIGKREINRVDRFFKKHGDYSVFLARLLPLFPINVVSFGAGLTKIGYKNYFIASMLAFLIWVLLLNSVGDILGRELFSAKTIILIVSVIVLLSLVFLFRHEIKRRLHRILVEFHKDIIKLRWFILVIIVLILFLIYNNVGLQKYPADTYLGSIDVLGKKIEYNRMIMNSTQPFFYDTGGEKAVLLLHGFGGSPFELRELGEYLAARNISVYAPLLSRHGSTIKELSKASWRGVVTEAEDSLTLLKMHYPEVYVGGISNGGLTALYLAEIDDVQGVISMASPIYMGYRWLYRLPLKQIIYGLKYTTNNLRKIKYGAVRNRAVLKEMPTFEGAPVTEIINVFELTEITRKNLNKIHEPILILQSKFDNRAAPESADLIYKSVFSDEKKLVYLENSGHIITLDYDKERVFEEVYEFIASN